MKHRTTWSGHGDLAASLVLIVPLLLAYEVGVLFAGKVSGVDVVTRALYGAVDRTAYLFVNVVLALGFLIWARNGKRWSALRLEIAGPLILEAAIYALTLGAVVAVVLDHILGLGATTASSLNAALGAGVHEELVFRLGLFAGLAAVLGRILRRRGGLRFTWLTLALAAVISSVAFAAAHHVGVHGEPWSAHRFAFRCVAGAAFAAIFWFRSLAHAVYAHVLYDILVTLV